MKLDERLRLLERRRQYLVARAASQRESLQARCQAIAAPLQAAGGWVERWRGWLAPAALIGAPLGVLLGRRVRLGRIVRLALTVWPLLSSLRHEIKRRGKPEKP